MIDPRAFTAPVLLKERIWQAADTLRNAYESGRAVPVRIIDLAEFDLGLEIIPEAGLRENLDIEALLLGDIRSILVDKKAFMNPHGANRSRQQKQQALEAALQQANPYLDAHPRAQVQTQRRRLAARLEHLKAHDWLKLQVQKGRLVITQDTAALQAVAQLDGCYVVKTDLQKSQAEAQNSNCSVSWNWSTLRAARWCAPSAPTQCTPAGTLGRPQVEAPHHDIFHAKGVDGELFRVQGNETMTNNCGCTISRRWQCVCLLAGF